MTRPDPHARWENRDDRLDVHRWLLSPRRRGFELHRDDSGRLLLLMFGKAPELRERMTGLDKVMWRGPRPGVQYLTSVRELQESFVGWRSALAGILRMMRRYLRDPSSCREPREW